MELFVDMDGVLADFDSGYEAEFGIRPSIHTDNVDWEMVRLCKDFYLNLPPMPDFDELWTFIAPLRPIVLTGVPWSVVEAPANKQAWARKHLGPEVEVRCCRSSEKCLNAAPGAVLIDDWEKYKGKWVKAGGTWITHTNAKSTIAQLTTFIAGHAAGMREAAAMLDVTFCVCAFDTAEHPHQDACPKGVQAAILAKLSALSNESLQATHESKTSTLTPDGTPRPKIN